MVDCAAVSPEPTFAAVVTTIQPPTAQLRRLAQTVTRQRGVLIVVGDRQGPECCELVATDFLSYAQQRRLHGRLAPQLPAGHYARKNLGYLQAMQRRVPVIFETDDDNEPNRHWAVRTRTVQAQPLAPAPWVNVYSAFRAGPAPLWPRGLPLDAVRGRPRAAGKPRRCQAPVQQELTDGDPDVDALWRLLYGGRLRFAQRTSVWLAPGTACPFNSQATWWWPEAWPLLYLPSHCSFRLTDIWRGFVAQRCLWALGRGLVYHPPRMQQRRNAHDLHKDLQDELPGYQLHGLLMQGLRQLPLAPGQHQVGPNLLACYQWLVAAGMLPRAELALVRAWLADLPG